MLLKDHTAIAMAPFGPYDASEGSIFHIVGYISQPDDGSAHHRHKIIKIGAHRPVKVSNKINQLAKGRFIVHSAYKGNC